MPGVQEEADQAGSVPLPISFCITAAMTVGLGGGLVGLFFTVVGAAMGPFVIAGLAVCVAAGFVTAAVFMTKGKPSGRQALTALAIVLIPGLPTFVSTYIHYTGDLDPIWWLISVAVAIVLVVPAWLPASSRWFTRSDLWRDEHLSR